MQIFIDFDDVLIDTRALKKGYFNVFGRFGVPIKKVVVNYAEFMRKFKVYKVGRHIKYLKETYPDLPSREMEKTLKNFFKEVKKYVFRDSPSFLKWLKSKDWNIIMVSSGDRKTQADKINSSGLKTLFNNIKIVDDYLKSKVLKKLKAQESFVFIDDKAEIVDDVKKNFPKALVIQMLRHQDQTPAQKADFVVSDFAKAKKYLADYV